jgi:hypothetical protein
VLVIDHVKKFPNQMIGSKRHSQYLPQKDNRTRAKWLLKSCGLSRGPRLRERRYDPTSRKAATHHLASFTLKVTVLAPPAFLMTNLYRPSFVGVTLTEHFGPGESSLATSAPEES